MDAAKGGPRLIEKPDGTRVEILEDGTCTVSFPDGRQMIYRADGKTIRVAPDGSSVEVELKKSVPKAENALNVALISTEPIGRLMSNLADTPFTLEGERYASVEAFYVCLKAAPEARRELRKLRGKAAKRISRNYHATETVFGGEKIVLGSPAHHELVKRAIRAKLAEHPEIAAAFTATHPRPIVHDPGWPDRPGTFLPAAVFVRVLTELRSELVNI